MSKGRLGHTYSHGYPSWGLVVQPGKLWALLTMPDNAGYSVASTRIDRDSLVELVARLLDCIESMDALPEDYEWELCDGAVRWIDSYKYAGMYAPPLRTNFSSE